MVQPHPVVSAPAGAGGHASVATYIRVAIVLAIVTAIEIGALYVPGVPTSALVTLLIVFSVAKFGLVVVTAAGDKWIDIQLEDGTTKRCAQKPRGT